MKIIILVKRINGLLSSQMGIAPVKFFGFIINFPRYLFDWYKFRTNYKGEMNFTPCLHDRKGEGGDTKSEYFWQDLLVARYIFFESPKRHIDIGSRIDGFVSHVASFREIEVIDIRPNTSKIPGIEFLRSDLMNLDLEFKECCDSLSCLHAVEHFGLGRYSDPIDPLGYARAIANMAVMLQPGGLLYLATPIGKERVEFNAHRIFNPIHLINLYNDNDLNVNELTTIRYGGDVKKVEITDQALAALSEEPYILALFVLQKRSNCARQH